MQGLSIFPSVRIFIQKGNMGKQKVIKPSTTPFVITNKKEKKKKKKKKNNNKQKQDK